MSKIVKPPHPLPKKVFLAGSIEMGSAPDWQAKVEKALPNAIVYNPRRDDWDSSWEQTIDNEKFREQVNWELDALEDADIIAMYIDPETKAPISLMELGLHAASGKLIVCCPDGFWRRGNVEMICDRFDIPLYSNFILWTLHLRGLTG